MTDYTRSHKSEKPKDGNAAMDHEKGSLDENSLLSFY